MTDAHVRPWGREIGAVSWLPERELGAFQYTSEFARSGIEIAPTTLPLREFLCKFPALTRSTFTGLPGLLADLRPNKRGKAIIAAWLAQQGHSARPFNPKERFCCTADVAWVHSGLSLPYPAHPVS